jgi:hypothetical protein
MVVVVVVVKVVAGYGENFSVKVMVTYRGVLCTGPIDWQKRAAGVKRAKGSGLN